MFALVVAGMAALGIGLAVAGRSYWMGDDRVTQAARCSGLSVERINAMAAELADKGGETADEARSDAVAIVCPRMAR